MTIDEGRAEVETNSAAGELVGDTWPAWPSAPDALAWRIPWPLAPLAIPFAVLFPRRWGPSLAASSWLAAFFVHAISVVWFIGSICLFGYERSGISYYGNYVESTGGGVTDFSLLDNVRRPFAAFAIGAYDSLTAWNEWAAVVTVCAFVECLFWIGPLGLLVLFTVGESRGALYLRCVKLTYWSTMCLVPFGIVLPYWIDSLEDARLMYSWTGPFSFFGPPLVWWFSVLVRLGGRVANPPTLLERTPLCEQCGYRLTSTPISGRCSECGLEVERSLPSARRLPPFAARWSGFVETALASTLAGRSGRAFVVGSHHRRARNFAYICIVLAGLMIALLSASLLDDPMTSIGYSMRDDSLTRMMLERAVFGVIALLLGGCWLLAVGALACWAGFKDAFSRVTAVCYSATWLLVMAFAWVFGTYLIAFVRLLPQKDITVFEGASRVRITLEALLILLALAPFAICAIVSVLQVFRWIRASRYANA
ncbi:MAG: hypothetical protein KDA32_03710 [Phycisphaerales bacterium]|nr:hypothetical protein [Phycisphaerales bacterium]